MRLKSIIAVLSFSLALVVSPNALATDCDRSIVLGEYSLCIKYLRKGTRSEGQNGRLFKGSSEIIGKTVDEQLELAGEQVKFYGATSDVSWGITGWNFADKSKIKSSWQK